jgi:hypothetical protein
MSQTIIPCLGPSPSSPSSLNNYQDQERKHKQIVLIFWVYTAQIKEAAAAAEQ